MEEPPKLPLKVCIKAKPVATASPPEPPVPRGPDVPAFRAMVEATLRKKIQETAAANLTGGVLLCAAGVVVLFFTYWFFYFALGIATGWLIKLPHMVKLLLCLAGIVGLFVTHFRQPREYFEEWTVTTRDGETPITFYLPHVGMVSNVDIFSLGNARSAVKFVCAFLLIAPQLFDAGITAVKRAGRLREMDAPGAAEIIGMTLGKARKVSFAEILAAAPHLDLCGIVAHLRDLDGVILLREPPIGITLAPDLRHDFLVGCGIDMPTM
jgi:hypothetical protein